VYCSSGICHPGARRICVFYIFYPRAILEAGRHENLRAFRTRHCICGLRSDFCLRVPKRIIFACCVVFLSAVILEYLQTLTSDRHGTLIDAFGEDSRRRARDLRCSRGPLVHANPPTVPELTRSARIQLNERVSWRRKAIAIAGRHEILPHPNPAWRNRRAIMPVRRFVFLHETAGQHADP